MEYEKIISKLKKEQNKTAEWIEYFNKKVDLIETKLMKIEETLDEMKDNDKVMAQHILKFHEKLNN